MLFFVPLCAALATTAMFLRADERSEWKVAAVIVLAISMICFFLIPALFFIGFILQILLSILILLYYRLY